MSKKKRITFKHHTPSRIASFVWLDWWSYRMMKVLVSLVPLDRINLSNCKMRIIFQVFFCPMSFFFFSLFFMCRTSHRRLPINLHLNYDWMWHTLLLPMATSMPLSSPPFSVQVPVHFIISLTEIQALDYK
jgi:hypothetical protein